MISPVAWGSSNKSQRGCQLDRLNIQRGPDIQKNIQKRKIPHVHGHVCKHACRVGEKRLTQNGDRDRESKNTNQVKPRPSLDPILEDTSGSQAHSGASGLCLKQKESFWKNIWPQSVSLATLEKQHLYTVPSDWSISITTAKWILEVSSGKNVEM